MVLSDLKFKESDFISKKISDLSNTPSSDGMTAEALKAYFDYIPKTMIALGAVNEIINLLVSSEGADNIGGSVTGVTGTTVQDILDSVKALIDDRYTKDATNLLIGAKADKTTIATMIKSVSFDPGTGIFKFTEQGGTVHTFDTAIEKIAVNFTYDSNTQSLVMILADGSEVSVPLNEFITNNEFSATDTIQPTVKNGVVTLSVKKGSITDEMLSSALLNAIQGYVTSCAASAQSASASETNAKTYADNAAASASTALESKNAAEESKSETEKNALLSKSYAVGGTGSRTGEDDDNAKYYANQAKIAKEAAEEAKNQAEEIAGGDYATKTQLNSHTENSTVHITAAERTKWNQAVKDVGTLSEEIANQQTVLKQYIDEKLGVIENGTY